MTSDRSRIPSWILSWTLRAKEAALAVRAAVHPNLVVEIPTVARILHCQDEARSRELRPLTDAEMRPAENPSALQVHLPNERTPTLAAEWLTPARPKRLELCEEKEKQASRVRLFESYPGFQ